MLDAQQYFNWVAETTPSSVARMIVVHFLARIAEQPCAYPSYPMGRDSQPPLYEIREAVLGILREPSIWVRYLRVLVTEDVIVLDVHTLQPDDPGVAQ